MADGPRMRLDAALDEAFGPGKTAAKDPGKALGDSIMEALLRKTAERASSLVGDSSLEAGSEFDRLLATAQKMQALKELFGGGAVASSGGMENGTMNALATMFKSTQEMMVAMQKTQAETQAKSEDRVMRVIEKQGDGFRDILDRLEKKMEGDGNQDPFRAIGLDIFARQLQRDPKAEEREQREQYFAEFERMAGGRQSAGVVDLEKWKFEKQVELEDRREERETKREQARAEAQGKVVGAVMAALGGRADPANAPDLPPPPAGPSLFRYACSECGKDFALTAPMTGTGHCPHCGTLLQVAADPGTAPPSRAPSADSAPADMREESADGGY